MKKNFDVELFNRQMERITHLMVTLTVGMAMLLCCLATLFIQNMALIILDVILMGLFLAYIFHYMKLENEVQLFWRINHKHV